MTTLYIHYGLSMLAIHTKYIHPLYIYYTKSGGDSKLYSGCVMCVVWEGHAFLFYERISFEGEQREYVYMTYIIYAPLKTKNVHKLK